MVIQSIPAMQVHIALPPDLLSLTGLLSPARAAQHVLRQCLEARHDPVPTAPGARSHPVYLSPDLYNGLLEQGALADKPGLFAAGVIEAWATEHRSVRQVKHADPLAGLPIEQLHAPQLELAAAALPALHAGKIAFCEASTGIGKSWVIALCAESARRAGKRVIIAAPSLGVLTQLVDAFHRLELDPPLPLLGRAQFVDPDRLREVIQSNVLPEDQRQALDAWDGRPLQAGVLGPLVRQAGALAWLREDALTLAPDLPLELVRFQVGEQIQAHQDQRELSHKAQVICTTHAMVASDMRMRVLGREVLPEFDWLILDEAHLFEDAVGQAFSDGVSVFSLRHQLRRVPQEIAKERRIGSALDRVLEATQDWMDEFKRAHNRSFVFGVNSNPDPATEQVLRQGAQRLLPDMRKIAKAGLEGLDLDEVVRALEGVTKAASPVSLTLSPVRRFPTVHVGSPGMRKNLAALWERIQAGMLVSATLYIETQEHGYSAGFLSGRLAVPPERCAEMRPVIAPWLYLSAQLNLPDSDSMARLVPPKHDEDESQDDPAQTAYYDAIAQVVGKATTDAKGGTLVLCTSYRAVIALESRLAWLLGERLVIQSPGVTLNALRSRFRDLYDQGVRPVWLATGAAGTGLDLRDERVAPAQDRLLTDLVITRLPLLPAANLVSQLRRSRMGLSSSRLDLVFMFRQWLGRLVRAEGQPDRRIWLADGRLLVADPQMIYLTGPCRRLLERYSRKVMYQLVKQQEPVT